MTISINQITMGLGLRINNDIYVVMEYNHVKPGKGSAFVRVKIKNILTHQVLERTFKSAEKLDEVELEERKLQLLYQSGDVFYFMDQKSFEEVQISKDDIGEDIKFLLDQQEVIGLCYNHKVLKINLSTFVEAEITQTEPGIKGDSTRAGNKPATIENGTVIQVPLFVDVGDRVRIDTRTGAYVERVKK